MTKTPGLLQSVFIVSVRIIYLRGVLIMKILLFGGAFIREWAL